MNNIFKYLSILAVLVFGAMSLWNGNPKSTNLKFGLDLVGGAQLKFQGLTTEQVTKITPEVMQGVEKVIQNRVNASGTTEAVVQRIGKDRLLVEIPGKNPETIKRRLLRTAKLEFKELGPDLKTWVNTGITGADLKRAQGVPDPSGSDSWILAFEMKPEGAEHFSKLTGRLLKGILPNGQQAKAQYKDENGKTLTQNRTNLPLAIFLDDILISQASVRGQISTNGQITGNFAQDEAIDLALQLNAGALPIPLKLIEERTVSPTLGKESLNKSLWAGLAGLGLIALYMLLIYRLPGILATLALVSYVIIALGLFANMVTLSSAGIAGFILSIGMAVDANILIFERIKEELRLGKTVYRAVEEGFKKAFPSILDSNLNTLLVCSVLLILGTGLVKGFAITLAIGVIVSFFSAIIITRELLNQIIKIEFFRKPLFFGAKSSD